MRTEDGMRDVMQWDGMGDDRNDGMWDGIATMGDGMA